MWTMGTVVHTLQDARRLAQQGDEYLLWVDERQAQLFVEPGWEELQPHRGGAALFVHRERERLQARRRGVL
jgi:hypothetical protein